MMDNLFLEDGDLFENVQVEGKMKDLYDDYCTYLDQDREQQHIKPEKRARSTKQSKNEKKIIKIK